MNQIKSLDHILYQTNCGLRVLNTKSIRISQNNVISVLNADGVCILRCDNNWLEYRDPNFLNFTKFTIDNPESTFRHSLHRIVRTYISRFNTEEFAKTNLDHTLFPWSQANQPSLYKGYRNLEWSFGDCLNDEPLFTLLSIEHELWIYKLNDSQTYEQAVNVSKILLENYTKTHKRKHDISYKSLKDIVYSTAIMKTCWTEFSKQQSNLNDDESANHLTKKRKRTQNDMEFDLCVTVRTPQLIDHVCLLIALSKNGILYFFKIKQNSEEIICTYLNEWQPDDLIIKDIYYNQGILILVYTNGTIELLRIDLDQKNFNEQDFEFTHLIKQRIILWDEEDDIEVDDLLIYERESLIYVVFTKTTFIIVRTLEPIAANQASKRNRNSSNLINQFNKSSTSNSINQSVINNHQELRIRDRFIEEGIFGLSASGICRLYDEKLLIASIDGTYVQAEFSDDLKKLKQMKLSLENISGKLEVKSVCSSKDGYLCCSISHLSIYFDHLEVRDATQFTIFTTIPKKDVFDKIIDLIDTKDETIQFNQLYNLFKCFNVGVMNSEIKGKASFMDYHQENLNEFIDLNLKVLRFALICEHSNIKRELPSTNLFEFMNDVDENFYDLEDENNNQMNESSRNKKKGSRNEKTNEVSSSDSVANRQSKLTKQKAEDYEEFIKRIEIVLSRRHFNRLLNSHSTKQNLTEQQHESFGLMSSYLNNKKKKTSSEICPICNQKLTLDDNLSQVTCKNGHQFSRCSYSLLICDLSVHDYKLCTLCKNHTSIVPSIWSSNQKQSYCLYCC